MTLAQAVRSAYDYIGEKLTKAEWDKLSRAERISMALLVSDPQKEWYETNGQKEEDDK